MQATAEPSLARPPEPMSDPQPAVVQPSLTVLGIETSCDETAAAVVRLDARPEVLSSVIATQFERHSP